MTTERYISPFVQGQFPQFYKEYGPNFIAFVRAYYEWLESSENPLGQARSMYSYADIDETLNNFVINFKNKYMLSLPENISSDKRLTIKHITDLYRAKGSARAYELLFRILFNEDLQVYIPGNDLFRLSNNSYIKPEYIEVSNNSYLAKLVGRTIQTSDGLGEAVVESYSTKTVDNKIINVLTLSSVTGSFKYKQKILCSDLYVNSLEDTIGAFEYNKLTTSEKSQYSLALTPDSSPFILGSLSAIGIMNGGTGFSVGESLLVNSSNGKDGIARVAAVRDENGKVTFTLIDGGSGFSVNAAVTVTGGGGSGATFKVGNLIDKEVFRINIDDIEDANTTILDTSADGCNLSITALSGGNFFPGDNVYSAAQVNVITTDVSYLVSNNMANGESLSNSTLGISSLVAHRVDKSLVYLNGSDINNANLTIGTTLISNTTSSVITINSKFAIQNTYGNGTVSFVNSSLITVTGDFGYFVPTYGIVSGNTGATATVTSITRNTNWTNFTKPSLNYKNLDASIESALITYDLEVGTIAFLSQINPGQGYSSNPTVSIKEQVIYDLGIVDGSGYKGFNASVEATAGTATGIVTSVDIIDSGFGYAEKTFANLSSLDTNNQTVVTSKIVIDEHGVGIGRLDTRSGFLSDTQHIIDSKYWQTQSYDLITSRMLETYETFVRDLVHPSGIALFGTYRILSSVDATAGGPVQLQTTFA